MLFQMTERQTLIGQILERSFVRRLQCLDLPSQLIEFQLSFFRQLLGLLVLSELLRPLSDR